MKFTHSVKGNKQPREFGPMALKGRGQSRGKSRQDAQEGCKHGESGGVNNETSGWTVSKGLAQRVAA